MWDTRHFLSSAVVGVSGMWVPWEECLMADRPWRKRWKYTPEYRVEAVRLVLETGRMIAAVARELGVCELGRLSRPSGPGWMPRSGDG